MLRQNFVFMIIPMLNPDGVYHGYYRLDVHGQNLNRHYRLPDYEKQPANYAVKKLVHHLHSENRLFFYSDLHSHASTKGCFFYGNALNTNMQVSSHMSQPCLLN
jgi:murein tripeptide amidase MpaA